MTSFQRQPAIKVAKIAREVAQWDRALTGMSDGGESAGSTIIAPALNTSLTIEEAEITPNSLVLSRVSDGHIYVFGTDFVQEQHGFLNVTITPGTELEATYLRGDFTLAGHRIQLNGTTLPQREFLNFLGDSGAVEDNEADGSTDVTLGGSGGGGSGLADSYPLPIFSIDGTAVFNSDGEALITWIPTEDLL